MDEARRPQLTNKVIKLIRDADVQGVKKELKARDEAEFALVNYLFLSAQNASPPQRNKCQRPDRQKEQ